MIHDDPKNNLTAHGLVWSDVYDYLGKEKFEAMIAEAFFNSLDAEDKERLRNCYADQEHRTELHDVFRALAYLLEASKEKL